MKKLILTALLLTSSVLYASAQQRFIAALRGKQEVPASGSPGIGWCRIALNSAQTQITVNCYFSSLQSNATAAHIHGNAGPGSTAPVLFGFTGVPAARGGTFGPQTFDVTPQQVADMRAHKLYVNIHSVNFVDGEIRGQIKQVHTNFDDDGDGRTDVTVYRPSTREFFVLNSVDGTYTRYNGGVDNATFLRNLWDFHGAGVGSKMFVSLNELNGIHWTSYDFNPPPDAGATIFSYDWGSSDFNDALAPADYDGDGDLDIAIFRRSTGDWWILDDLVVPGSHAEHWGTTNDQSCVGDFDGDGKADLCAARAESGQRVWYIRNSSTGQLRREVFGLSTDAVQSYGPIDIDGDGKQDLMTLRQTSGQRIIYILRSTDGQLVQISWGLSTDDFLFGDYDGDGKTDFVARRLVNGLLIWYILRSSDGQAQVLNWGLQGDV